MRKNLSFLLLVVLSALFTFAFFFLMLKSVQIIDDFLLNFFPDLHTDWEGIRVTTEFLRPFGYATFGIVLILILVGFAIRKGYLSTIGSIGLYLPVFGYFASTMFFLAGIGVTRALWLPLVDCSPFLSSLGIIVIVPFFLFFIDVHRLTIALKIGTALSYMIMGAGFFIFFFGVLTWLYGKFKGREIIDFWIYKVSRHPQYLGLLLWSYGMLALTLFLPTPRYSVWPPLPYLPWLVSALTLIGTAIDEETKMTTEYGEKYLKYRSSTPFMLPLPRQISDLILFPVKFSIKKNMPENRKELVYALTIYGITLILLSVLVTLIFMIRL